MTSIGIRDLKDNLSRVIARAAAGERVVITDHGRPVAELGPTMKKTRMASRYEELVAAGILRPAIESGDPLEGAPRLRLPKGTAAALINEDRGER